MRRERTPTSNAPYAPPPDSESTRQGLACAVKGRTRPSSTSVLQAHILMIETSDRFHIFTSVSAAPCVRDETRVAA